MASYEAARNIYEAVPPGLMSPRAGGWCVAVAGDAHGGAVQVGPIKPTVKAPGTKRLKLKYDKLLSMLLQVCFQFQFAPLQHVLLLGMSTGHVAQCSWEHSARRGVVSRGTAVPHVCCSPRHPHSHAFEPSFLELNAII
jgi:hypothetical protein